MARQIGTKKAVQGLEELQANVADLINRFSGTEAQAGMAQIAKTGAWMLESEARDQNWPHEAVESVFSFGKLPPERRQKKGPSALFGFRKRGRSRPWAPGYVEWGKRTGKLVGESLATMYEFGTAKMSAKPAARQVVTSMRAMYPDMVAKVFKQLIEKYAK